MTKMERMSNEVLKKMPAAAERLKNAAADSAEVARETRARLRRQRMASQQSFPPAKPEDERLEMPDDWRDDEPTGKITLPCDEKYEKKKK
jgi:hypothetical protein